MASNSSKTLSLPSGFSAPIYSLHRQIITSPRYVNVLVEYCFLTVGILRSSLRSPVTSTIEWVSLMLDEHGRTSWHIHVRAGGSLCLRPRGAELMRPWGQLGVCQHHTRFNLGPWVLPNGPKGS